VRSVSPLVTAIACACLVAIGPATALAQTAQPEASQTPATTDPWQSITFNATLESYYEYNANRPADRINLVRAYDTRANTFGIQQAALVIESAPDRGADRPFGLRLDLQFGQAVAAVQGSPANEPRSDLYRNVWQAYGSYVFPGSHAVRVDVGKFGSSLGVETNYAKDDQAFSRALLFDFLPFYHEGVRLTAPVNDTLTVSYMLTNGVQQTEDFNNFKSNQIEAVVTPIKTITWTVNYYAGQEQPDHSLPDGPDGWFRVFDTYVTYSPNPTLTLGGDVNRTTNQVHAVDPSGALTGAAGYARYQLDSQHALGVRYEHLDDSGGLFAGVAQTVEEVTLTFEHKTGDGFLIRGEYRRDWSDTGVFPGRAPSDALKTGQNTALIGFVWWIGAKSGGW
jgi:hypothetical protein